jgi:hypothetical protein
MDELRKATRKTIIENVKITHVKRGDPFFPPDIAIEGNETASEVWAIYTTYRTGLQPSKSFLGFAFSEDEANAFRERHRVGSEIPEPQCSGQEEIDAIRAIMKSGSLLGVSAGDRESPLAFKVLGDSGIYQGRFRALSSEVIEFLGEQRVSEIKKLYGENWQIAAAFEYCWLNLPHSSPAFVAASYQYHYYITEDDFSAGYNWRDLEIMVHRVEAEALKAIETRKKAGKSGSEKSAKARETRRAALMVAFEDVAGRNPDLLKLGVAPLAKLALEKAVETDPSLWRQGKGQVMEYAGEIRRGEAGEYLKARFEALFPAKPPKRFD